MIFALNSISSTTVHESWRPGLRTVAGILALSAIYFITGKLGLSLATVHPSASAIWPPSGIALAAFLLWGYRLWPGVFLGAFLVNITTQGTVSTALGIASGNTLEALLGAWLIHEVASGAKAFERARNIVKFVLASLIGTAVGATFGTTSLTLGGYAFWNQYVNIWFTWWLGDLAGDLLIAPLLVIWVTQPYPTMRPLRIVEAAAVLVSLVLIGYLVFLGRTRAGLEFLAVLPLLWAAFRFGQRGAVTAAFFIFAVALWGTAHSAGPFGDVEVHQSFLHLQGFTATMAMAALVLAAVVTERSRVEQRLEMQEAVSRILAESHLDEAGSKILQILCERAKWSSGALWNIDRESNDLVCMEFWHEPSAPARLFENESRKQRFAPGVGLPGRVWSSGRPAWIRDVIKDSNFPRAATAAEEGLRAGFGFPIKVADEIVGVIECFSREVREIDDEFLRIVNDIGDQVGRFFERKRAEELLAKAKDELGKANEELEIRVRERTVELELANAALLKNIEEQKRLEEQLRQAQKMESIGTLAGGIAHDFNNSLNIIKAYATLIGSRHSDQQIVEGVKVINDEIDRGASVVRQLLTLARKTETRLERTDVNKVLTMVSELVKETFPKNIDVRLSLDGMEPAIMADSNQISQALLNICVNARDAMHTGGELTLAAETIDRDRMEDLHTGAAANTYACIAITDTGTGIEESVRPRIFDPFFTTKGIGEGTGLGLAMVYGIMKNHHGFIDVESSVGKGTTFRLYLPAAVSGEKSAVIQAGSGDRRTASGINQYATVLVVEDEQAMTRLLGDALLQAGYHVLVALDGAEAIELYRHHLNDIHAVVLDLGLPRIAGPEVIRIMKELNRHARIIVTTGYLEPELKSELFAFGVKDYIQKPYSVDSVLEKLQSVMSAA